MPIASRYDLILSDLDGVVYRGARGIGANIDALNRAKAEGAGLGYITNNASRSNDVIAEHLRDLGLHTEEGEILSSPQAVAPRLRELVPDGSRVLVMGGQGLQDVVASSGYQVVSQVLDAPAAVVQGFAPEVSLAELTQVAFAVQTGIPWLATNSDRAVPKEHGVAPGNGAMIQAVFWATGEMPEVVGKPQRAIFERALQRWEPANPVYIGDRLDTDILGARRACIDSVFVLTGIDGPKELLSASGDRRPTFIVEHLGQLFEPYPEVTKEPDGAVRCGETVVALRGTRQVTVLQGEISSVDALRATARLVWSTPYGFSGCDIPREIWLR